MLNSLPFPPATLPARPRSRTLVAALVATAVAVTMTSLAASAAAATPTTIAVGNAPVGIRITPDGTRAYAANFISNSVSVINTATGSVTQTIAIGSGTNPFGVAVAPDGARAYVTDNSAGTISVIDTATNAVTATIPVAGQGPRHLAISADGTRGYLTNNGSGTVNVLDLTTNTVIASKFIGTGPAGIALSPDGSRAYVALQGDRAVAVIDTATNTVINTITGLGEATGLVLSPDGGRAYVSDYAGGNVSVIDTATDAVIGSVPIGGNPYELAVAPDGSRVYVADDGANALKVIDASTDTLTGSVTVGASPTDVAVAPDGSALYVTNTGSNTVTVLKPPAITSGASASVPVGQPFTFTVTASGAPTAALPAPANLPAWLNYTDNGDGTATLSGTPPSGSAGVAQFVLTASNALNQQAQTFTLTVTRLPQAITFTSTPPANAAVGGSYDISATGGTSGQPVTFSVTTPGVCSITAAHVTFTATGVCTINADQAGDADHDPAPTVSQSLSVAAGAQVITFTSTPPANATVGDGYDVTATGGPSTSPVVFSIPASSAAVCAISGAHLTFTAAGTCTVDADQAGNGAYDPAATVSQSIVVGNGSAPTWLKTFPAVRHPGKLGANTIVVRARLTTPAGSAVTGVTLTFTLGQGTCVATTDSDGFASCNIAFSASAAVPATYTVSFAGTSAYAQNSSDGPVVPSALS